MQQQNHHLNVASAQDESVFKEATEEANEGEEEDRYRGEWKEDVYR